MHRSFVFLLHSSIFKHRSSLVALDFQLVSNEKLIVQLTSLLDSFVLLCLASSVPFKPVSDAQWRKIRALAASLLRRRTYSFSFSRFASFASHALMNDPVLQLQFLMFQLFITSCLSSCFYTAR
jgi:hypothetical protein